MPSIERRLNNSAILKGSTWGTSVNCGVASAGISPINPGAAKQVAPGTEVDDIVSPFETNVLKTNFNAVDYPLDFNFQFDGNEAKLLALLMGTAGAPTGAGTAKTHTLVMANSVSGLFCTHAFDKNDKVHCVPSAKVMKVIFSGNNGLIKSAFSMRGRNLTDADGTVTALTSVTYPAIHNQAKLHQAVFQLNAQTGADFAGGDAISPKNFTIEIERKCDSEFVAGSQYILEPREIGKPTVKLTVDLPRMDTTNGAWLTSLLADTEHKAALTITGAAISGGGNYTLKFQFPRLKLEDVEYPDGNIIGARAAFRAVLADAAPTGMTGLLKPVTITLICTRTSDLLA